MRVLFLTNYYPPHHIGGYEELCAEVASGLRGRGHLVSILTSAHGIDKPALTEEAVYRVLHPEVDLRRYRAIVGYFWGRQARCRRNRTALEHVVRTVRPEVTLVWGMWNVDRRLLVAVDQGMYGAVAYYIADVWPALADSYTLFWSAPARSRTGRWPKAALARLAARRQRGEAQAAPLRFDRVACVSRALRDELLHAGLPLGNARVIHNGICVEAYTMPRRAQSEQDVERRLSLLYAGRLSPDKGLETAIEALGLVTSRGTAARLTCVGRGEPTYEHKLRRLARECGVAEWVSFRGYVPRERMPEVLAEADILVVPSTCADALPRSVQEGMASGLVVIGSRVGGIPEIVSHGENGLTFAAGDASDLAALIVDVATDAVLRSRLAAAGRRTVEEHFSIGRMVEEVERYLVETLAGRAGPRSPSPAVR